ncbi:hypothetical protein [Roseinatronobacter monicus]|uniref:Uncharacterized protein n=1 Tax=Roseinatronobacter monicus TaxID=393481 RepID=A0A543KBG1_9RHOB|nr:hypothetical protein [Roseinatronobacter monicus]TQM92406.1 hypothetical protein BD293_1011 [Roseinatronobacter monicus]
MRRKTAITNPKEAHGSLSLKEARMLEPHIDKLQKLADGQWHRFSTETEDPDKATEMAMKSFYSSEDRLKNKLPQSTKTKSQSLSAI